MSSTPTSASTAATSLLFSTSPLVSCQSAAPAIKQTRKRVAYSCTQCKKRKKQCDRNVPGCSQCRSRNEVHLCQWGDERDRQASRPLPPRQVSSAARYPTPLHFQQRRRDSPIRELSSSHLSPGEIDASGPTRDSSSTIYHMLSPADAHNLDESNRSLFMTKETDPLLSGHGKRHSSARKYRDTSRGKSGSPRHHLRQRRLPTCDHARHLFNAYRQHMSMNPIPIDEDAVWQALDQVKTDRLEDVRHIGLDIYALIVLLCASSLILLPPTYGISLGLLHSAEEFPDLLDEWDVEVFEALDEFDMFLRPSLIGVQVFAMYQLTLAHRLPCKLHIQRVDELTRAARRLGLDRLGSVHDDERLWLEEDLSRGSTARDNSTTALSGYWAADTLSKREKKLRNMGRGLWLFVVAKEWAAARMSGSCAIHPSSFTTAHPLPYSDGGGGMSEKKAVIWAQMEATARLTFEPFNFFLDCQAKCQRPDYDRVLEMDAELMHQLDTRPAWLLPAGEDVQADGRGQSSDGFEAIMVSSILWHRMYSLHRPFLALSRMDPDRYGLSTSRTLRYAILSIRIMRECKERGAMMSKQLLLFPYRLVQAALVLITHLFLDPMQFSMEDTIAIHQDLHFVISTVKQFPSSGRHNNFFDGQGERMEVLLAAAARSREEKRSLLPRAAIPDFASEEDRRDHARPFQMSSREQEQPQESLPSQACLLDQDAFLNLDEQLLRLSEAWPQYAEEDVSMDEVWNGIFNTLNRENPF